MALPTKSPARQKLISAICGVLRRHHVTEAYLFGSFARGEKRYHDIDVAITPPVGKFSLFDLVGLEQELEDTTAKKIDLVTLGEIRPAYRAYVQKDLTAIL